MSKYFDDIIVFCDFDGTITLKDVGNKLFEDLSNFEQLNKEFKQGLLTIYEYWHRLCNELPNGTTLESLKYESSKYEIDPYFIDFINYCKSKKIKIYIVSDGFDVYISQILELNDIDLEVSSNKMVYYDDKIVPIFPNASESCKCFSANCKRNFLLNKSTENTLKVYIGDGYSDFCGATHCDIIFAKRELSAYCNENSLPHYNFKTFFDVKRILEKKINENQLKKRNRASVESSNAYKYE